MRRSFVVLAVMLLAGLVTAQGQLPIPGFSRIWAASLTRGFYFQAPVDFTVIGLRVPDESKKGQQFVALQASADMYEGLSAFLEKRRPKFQDK